MTPLLTQAYATHAMATCLVLTTTLLPAEAQIPWATDGLSRQGKTEVYGIGQYLHSDDINFNGPFGTVKTKMDDTGLGGFGVAYHFSDFSEDSLTDTFFELLESKILKRKQKKR